MSFTLPSQLLNDRMRPGDPYFNYCHWSYDPPASGAGKLKPASLLYRAVSEMPHGQWVLESLRAIRDGLGEFSSVYGIKRINNQWAVEIYIYDYARENRMLSIEHLQQASKGRLRFPQIPDPRTPYFMFSFDLTESAAIRNGALDAVHVYIGNPGSQVSSGVSYELTQHGRQLENFYFFFDARQHEQDIVDKIQCSVHFEPWQFAIQSLYRPELKNCHTICLANKRTCDTVYYSGVDVEQLIFFLEWQNYPESFVHFVKSHAHELDHLLYDVGIDYAVRDGRLECLKHGVYGVF